MTPPRETAFEPRIVGFLCNWCAYSGADLAGVARIASSPSLHIVRVMCTGRIDPTFVLHALAAGADGVLLAGCHPGDCHYSEGNYKCLRRALAIKQLVRAFGIEEERVRLEWISASEGEKYARVSREMEADLRRLGPLRWNDRLTPQGAARPRAAEAEPMEVADA